MTSILRRAALAAMVVAGSTLSAPVARAQPAAFTLDGLRDDAYRLLAEDPSGDLAAGFSTVPASDWADLTDLSVATDTTHLWIYVDLPSYNASSAGEFGLAIDTDGLASSGGPPDPWGNGLTFAYTSTQNNVNATPVITTQTLLPDAIIRGRLYSQVPSPVPQTGYTELRRWDGSVWTGATVDWGGISNTSIGTHLAFAYGHGIELSIPFSDLGVAPTTTLHLEFYATGPQAVAHAPEGAWDTIPPDAQSSAPSQATVQRRLATFNPLAPIPLVSFSTSSYSAAEANGTAPITVTVAPSATRLISFTMTTTDGTAGPADYVAVSQVFTIAPGSSLRVVPIHILADALVEPDETVHLSLSQPANADLGAPMTATLTIHDSPPISAPPRIFIPLLRR